MLYICGKYNGHDVRVIILSAAVIYVTTSVTQSLFHPFHVFHRSTLEYGTTRNMLDFSERKTIIIHSWLGSSAGLERGIHTPEVGSSSLPPATTFLLKFFCSLCQFGPTSHIDLQLRRTFLLFCEQFMNRARVARCECQLLFNLGQSRFGGCDA